MAPDILAKASHSRSQVLVNWWGAKFCFLGSSQALGGSSLVFGSHSHSHRSLICSHCSLICLLCSLYCAPLFICLLTRSQAQPTLSPSSAQPRPPLPNPTLVDPFPPPPALPLSVRNQKQAFFVDLTSLNGPMGEDRKMENWWTNEQTDGWLMYTFPQYSTCLKKPLPNVQDSMCNIEIFSLIWQILQYINQDEQTSRHDETYRTSLGAVVSEELFLDAAILTP